MIDLMAAITEAFDALTGTFPNGVYLGKAPDKEPLPVAEMTFVGNPVPSYATQNSDNENPIIETVMIQFDVYFDMETNTDTDVYLALKAIDGLFNNKELGTEYDTFLSGRRKSGPTVMEDDSTTWRGLAVYRFRVQPIL